MIEIIDLLKPKNGGSFKLIEDIDIAVNGYSSLADCVAHMATTAMIEAINAALSGKQDKLTTAQLTACNSGITSELVAQITANATAIAGKADSSDFTTATANLQAQIDELITPVTQDAEVQNARVDSSGVSHTTLKQRIDSSDERVNMLLGVDETETEITDWYNYGAAVQQGTTLVLEPNENRLCNVTTTSQQNNLHKGDKVVINLLDSTNYKYAFALFSGNQRVQGEWGYRSSSVTVEVGQDSYLVVMISNVDGNQSILPSEASNVEVATKHDITEITEAKIDNNNVSYPTLKDRLNTNQANMEQLITSISQMAASKPYKETHWYNEQVGVTAYAENTITPSNKRLSNVTSFNHVNNLSAGDSITISLLDSTNYKYACGLFVGDELVQGTWTYNNESKAITARQSCYLIVMISNVDGELDIAPSEAETAIKVDVVPSYYGLSKWYGKTAVFVGDSITYGVNTSEGNRYWELLAAKCGFTATGMGVAGSCWSVTSDYGSQNSPITSRWETIPDKDLICVFAGTNDYGHNTPLGTIADSTDISFYGALNVVIGGLVNKYYNRRIFLMTPLHRYNFGGLVYDTDANSAGYKLEDYVNAMKDVAKKYGVPVIDTFSISGMNPLVANIKTNLITDGLHPNAAGHALIADRTYELINTL